MTTPAIGSHATLLPPLLIGFLIAAPIALVAWCTRSLSRSGAIAATIVGTIAVRAGYEWGILLVAFFVSSTLLSRLGQAEKARRSAAILSNAGARDATQVMANGALFALAALGWVLSRRDAWMAVGAGALAAACADTWSTELGTLARAAPRLITSGRIVPVGTSGGVTATGFAATAGGAALIGGGAWLLRWPAPVAIAAGMGGIVGALADSLIGALWQARRRCERCDALTERTVHDCGTATGAAGGLAWLDNDGVNAVCTAIGALAALALWLAIA